MGQRLFRGTGADAAFGAFPSRASGFSFSISCGGLQFEATDEGISSSLEFCGDKAWPLPQFEMRAQRFDAVHALLSVVPDEGPPGVDDRRQRRHVRQVRMGCAARVLEPLPVVRGRTVNRCKMYDVNL